MATQSQDVMVLTAVIEEHFNSPQLARTANNHNSIREHSENKKNDVYVLLIIIMVVTLRV